MGLCCCIGFQHHSLENLVSNSSRVSHYLKLPGGQLHPTVQDFWKDVVGAKCAAEGEHLKLGLSCLHRLPARVQVCALALEQRAYLQGGEGYRKAKYHKLSTVKSWI